MWRRGKAVSLFALRSHGAFPVVQGRVLPQLLARDSYSSCSGTLTLPHRFWNRESTRTSHTTHPPLEDRCVLVSSNLVMIRAHHTLEPFRWLYPPGQGSLVQLNLPPSHVLQHRQTELMLLYWFIIDKSELHESFLHYTDQLLHPSGASVDSPGSTRCPVFISKQWQSSLATQAVPLAERTFPSVQ